MVMAGWDAHPERGQEPRYRLGGTRRSSRGAKASEIGVQLAIAEPVSGPPRPVDGKGSLAYPGCSRDCDDRRGGILSRNADRVEIRQLSHTADERGTSSGNCRGTGPGRTLNASSRDQPRVGAQDLLMEGS